MIFKMSIILSACIIYTILIYLSYKQRIENLKKIGKEIREIGKEIKELSNQITELENKIKKKEK